MADIISKDTALPRKPTSPKPAQILRSRRARWSSWSNFCFLPIATFTKDPDAILDEIGFGRAHHRVLHFVNHYPGLRVADLLDILKITKQSLARVLKQLVDEGMIEQRPGPLDRRERRLFSTKRGQKLAATLDGTAITPHQQSLEIVWNGK